MISRAYTDRCPGILRPWIADDGALIRLRLIGGRVSTATLRSLLSITDEFADGTIHLTKRANLQLRGIEHVDGVVPTDLVRALTDAGLLPSPTHELVRNIMVSPLSGLCGGHVDMRPVADDLDQRLCADTALADLAGRFLFVLDDGRGDIAARSLDLGCMAVTPELVQVRVGSHHWGPLCPPDELPEQLIALARCFVASRSSGRLAQWHLDELPAGGAELLAVRHARDLRTQVSTPVIGYGIIAQDNGRMARHVEVPDGLLTGEQALVIIDEADTELIVTPWRSIVIPDLEHP